MAIIARIDDTEISSEDLIRYLKMNNKFDQIVEDMISERLTTAEAPKVGITVSDEEIQVEADNLRRAMGLHRAQDTFDFLDSLGLTVDGFEATLRDGLLRQKLVDKICSEQAVNDYFDLHSPKFESVDVSRIVLDSEGKAREVLALLEEEPEEFTSLARSLSVDRETREKGGHVGTVTRGDLQNEVEAKIFNSAEGEVLGPFDSQDGSLYEILTVTKRRKPTLDLTTQKAIAKKIYDDWLDERVEEHRVEIL